MRAGRKFIARLGAVIALILVNGYGASAQLNENCTVSVLNRNVRVNADGSWVLPNIPANFGPVKARATCVQNGLTTFGESAFFAVPANGAVNLPAIMLGSATQIPVSLTITPSTLSLSGIGQTVQLAVIATYPNGSTRDVTTSASGTNYTTSNPAIATVGANGLVTAMSSGTVVIQATNDGAMAIKSAMVVLSSTDSDGDGIPDDVEISLGLDPHNPVDAQEDFDRDGLTNLREYQLGTDIRKADTDGDGINDGDEVDRYHTNPLLADTDGDGIPDGVEIQTGSDPLNKNSFDLNKATASFVLQPPAFVLTTSPIFPGVSTQLSWRVNLIDGKTTLDLTGDTRTSYSSSNLNVCNFGATKGQVFAGSAGNCTITLSNNTLTVTVPGTVQAFTPTPLSVVNIPGGTNKVAVSGNYAYVAAASAGLQIVDVTDHAHPRIAAAQALPGNANGIAVAGGYAYVAAGSAGLRIINVTNPLAPALSGSLALSGTATDVVVKANRAYIASGSSGLMIVDVTSPSAPVLLGTLSLSGTTSGVDVDPMRQIAVVARGTSGLSVIKVSNPAAPALLATLASGDVRDVTISGNYAFLADYSRSFTSVDLTNPSSPVLGNSTPQSTGGLLQDVAVFGTVAAGADVFFVNGVPMIDVSAPASPQPRFIIDFKSYGDDNGVGIAMDSSYVYLTTDRSRLFIGQYNLLQDTFGIPPSVTITSPAQGASIIQGTRVSVTANATDDVSVASVTFFVNGQAAFIDTTAPYEYTFTAPSSGTTLPITATAADIANNISLPSTVTLNMIPDPGTTVVGKVVDGTGNPVSGATVATNGGRSAITLADGSFSITQVPTILGNIVVNVTLTTPNGTRLAGFSGPAVPIPSGITTVGSSCVAPTSGLVSWWPADGNTNDIIGGMNGTIHGNVTFTQTPAIGSQSFQFDGGSYIQVPTSPQLEPALITVSAWVKASSVGAFKYILSKQFGSSDGSYALYTGSSGGLYFYVSNGPGTTVLSPNAGSALWNGGFHHIAGTFDGGTVRLFVDGTEIGNGTPNARLSYSTPPNDLFIGTFAGSTSGTLNWPGIIDEVQIFDRALTATEIRNIFLSGTGQCSYPDSITIAPIPVITSINPKYAFSGDSISAFQITGQNLTASTFAFTPSSLTLGAPTITIGGTGATFGVTVPTTTTGTFTLTGTNSFGSSNAVPSSGNTLTVLGDRDADSDGDGYPDGLEVFFGSDPLDQTSIPNLTVTGNLLGPAFSVLNNTTPFTGQPAQQEVLGLAFSVLNNTAPFTGQAVQQDLLGPMFSVLNNTTPFTGLPTQQDLLGPTFSVLNNTIPSTTQQNLLGPTFSVLNAPVTSPLTQVDSSSTKENVANKTSSGSTGAKGKARAVRITAPVNGTTLIEGQTIKVLADVLDDAQVDQVQIQITVNSVPFITNLTVPYELMFTVPANVTSLTFRASAIDGAGTATSSEDVKVSVTPDRLMTVRGRVVDASGAPINGARVELVSPGLQAEFFDFDVPLTTLPSLEHRRADKTGLASAINTRNPDEVFGGDPFGVQMSPDYAARFSGWLRIETPGAYQFYLGADEGARLIVGGVTVVDIPTGHGEFQEGSGIANLPAGLIPIEVTYYDSVGNAELQLSYQPPGGRRQVVPPSALVANTQKFSVITDEAGAFSIVGIPTLLDNLAIKAIDANGASSEFFNVLPVPGEINVGDVVVPRPR